MKNIIKILIIPIAFGLFSCEEDFLEISDPNVLSPAVYPTTMQHMDLLLNSVYADQHSFGLYGHNIIGKLYYPLDHNQDMAWDGFDYWNDLSIANVKQNNIFLKETWRDAYRAVQHCNNFLEALPDFRSNYATQDDLPVLEIMEGQVYFMRAWYYFLIQNVWSEDITNGNSMGVPLILSVADERDAMYVQRATVKEVWDQIIADLMRAESFLQGHVWDAPNKARINEWAVKGLLGKVYAFTEDWTNAQSYLKNVIDNSGKSLVSFDIYKDMFNGENEFNSESLFEINLDVDKNTWGAWGPSAGSGVGMVIGPCYMNNDGASNGSGWSNVFVHDKNLERFGYTLDLPPLIDNPDFIDTIKVSINNLDKIPDPAFIQQSLALRENKTTDPRILVSTLEPYVDSMFADDRLRPIMPYKDVETTYHAWSFRKYVSLDGNEYSLNVNNGSNFYILRLADIYLLYAEALIEGGGSQAEALEYINKVKRRAYAYPVNAPSPVDYTSLTDNTTASDPVLGSDPLKYERWAELFGEGHWWFDVRRWKIGKQEADYFVRTRGGTISWQDTDYAMPIPQDELETNPNIEQNPGY